MFLCTLSQFFLAPLIWAFLGGAIGIGYPGMPILSEPFMDAIGTVFMGIGAIKQGAAGALVSMGNTGAVVGAATLGLGTLEGVRRPGIAVTTAVLRPKQSDRFAAQLNSPPLT